MKNPTAILKNSPIIWVVLAGNFGYGEFIEVGDLFSPVRLGRKMVASADRIILLIQKDHRTSPNANPLIIRKESIIL
jgi:hypothetical protein